MFSKKMIKNKIKGNIINISSNLGHLGGYNTIMSGYACQWCEFTPDEEEEDDDLDTNHALLKRQKGAYPSEVAEHLAVELAALDTTFTSNNEIQEDVVFSKSFEDLNIDRFGNGL